MLNDSDSELKHDVMCALISTDPSVSLNFTLVWLMLIDSDWCWLVLIAADWCWMMLIDSDWSWLQLMPIASDWCWLMLILIGNDWFLLMLINWYIYIWLFLVNVDWCWLIWILIQSSLHDDAVRASIHRPSRQLVWCAASLDFTLFSESVTWWVIVLNLEALNNVILNSCQLVIMSRKLQHFQNPQDVSFLMVYLGHTGGKHWENLF